MTLKNAKFIWTPEQAIDASRNFWSILRDGPYQRDDGQNSYWYFRREYYLEQQPSQALAKIFADGRYKLFINGQWVSRGPARSGTDHPRYDAVDISSQLRPGKNVIAILAMSYGVDISWYERATNYWQSVFGDGGLMFDAEISEPNNITRWQSDETWSCLSAKSWKQDSPRIGWGLGFIEDYDANQEPEGWIEAGFDDSRWDKAQVLILDGGPDDLKKGFASVRPFPLIARSELPALTIKDRLPSTLLNSQTVSPNTEQDLYNRLYIDTFEPINDSPQPACFPLEIRTDEQDRSFLFKFDELRSGYPYIEITAQGGELIEVAVAETIANEFNSNAATANRLTQESRLDGKHLFRYTAKPGKQRFERFELTAVRYLQLVVRNAPNGITLEKLGSVDSLYPAEITGAFQCSDTNLDRLWQYGANTVLQCSQDAWLDCPSREQRQWLGDGAVRYRAATATFGPGMQALDRNFIIQCAESQRTDGLLQMFAPGDHKRTSVVIPDFSLQWIMVLFDYVLYTADLEIAEQVFPVMEKILAWFQRNEAANGLLENLPYWHFIEWAHIGRQGQSTPINALYIGALTRTAELAEKLENHRAAKRYLSRANSLRSTINKTHWNAERSLYVDEVIEGRQGERYSQQSNALMIYFAIAPEKRWDDMLNAFTQTGRVKLTEVPPVTKGEGPFDPKTDVVKANSFFAHFVYQALTLGGRFDLALEEIRSAYAPMLVEGNQTLWESFEPTTSLCHAFSATPSYQFSAHILGVQPITAGFSIFEVYPRLCDITWAGGSYPTIHGNIEVSWERDGDQFTLLVVAPENTCGHIRAPEGWVHKEGPLEVSASTSRTTFVAPP